MNKNKFTTVTKSNIHLIAKRLNDYLQRHETVECQGDWGKIPKMCNRLGLKDNLGGKHIEKTCVYYKNINNTEIEVDTMFGKTFIRISTGSHSASLIYVGDKVKIAPYNVFTRTWDTILKKTLLSTWKPCQDRQKAMDYHYEMEDDYLMYESSLDYEGEYSIEWDN